MKKILVLTVISAALVAAQPAEMPQPVVKTSSFPVEIGYIVELPPGFDTSKTYPLIVAIHGFGDRMSAYNGTAQAFYPEGAIGLYPESPYPFFMEDVEQWGWTWWHWSDTAADPFFISREVTLSQSIRWVVQTIEEVKRDYPVDEEAVFLFGFSQGGFLTFTVGLAHPHLFRGLLPAGGWMEFDSLAPLVLDSAAYGLPVRILQGAFDEVVEPEAAQTAFDSLAACGVPVELMWYPVGHSLPRELFDDCGDFVYCELYEGEPPPLTDLLWPDSELEPEAHAELLRQVLCASDPVADIEAGLLALFGEESDIAVRSQIIYLLGAKRCVGAEELLKIIIEDTDQPQVLRQASLTALNKLGTETAWQATDRVEKKTVIREIVPGSQADSLGLAPGDVILKYNRKTITTYVSFREAFAAVDPDKKRGVVMIIEREGERIDIELAPGRIGVYLDEHIK